MAMTHALVIFSLSPRMGIWGVSLELMGGKLDKRGKSVNVNVHVNTCSIHFFANSCVCACVCSCKCCSTHGSGCVVDGGSATAAIYFFKQLLHCIGMVCIRTYC